MPFKVGIWITVFITTLGLLAGTLNLMNPQAVHIPFGPNGESAEGMDGVIAATLSSAVLGVVIGVPAAIATWLLLGRNGTGRHNQ